MSYLGGHLGRENKGWNGGTLKNIRVVGLTVGRPS